MNLTTEQKKQLVDKIRNTLSRQSFADWYADSGDFGIWISDDSSDAQTAKVNDRIEKMFLN